MAALLLASVKGYSQINITFSQLQAAIPPTIPKTIYVTQDSWREESAISFRVVNAADVNNYTVKTAVGDIIQPEANGTVLKFFVSTKILYPSNFPVTIPIQILNSGVPVGTVNIDAQPFHEEKEPKYKSLADFVMHNLPEDSHYDSKRNLLLVDNTIHVFLDEAGNFLYGGLPTTATQENTYQFHVATFDDAPSYRMTAQGVFKPAKLSIFFTDQDEPVAQAAGVPPKVPSVYDFAIEGPFTDKAKFKIENRKAPASTILDAEISIAKLYHVSVSTGFMATTLRNPSNIVKMAVPNGQPGDSTLVADDPAARGLVSILATYYPKGRSFLLPPSGDFFGAERFGIIVGAQLNDKLQENLLAGLSFDFARGGSIAFGAHFGRRNYVAGYDRFKFGKDLITGDLVVKKEWQVGLFFGVVVDTRVALKLFNIGDPK